MLEAILQIVKQMDAEAFYKFCSELFYSGNPCYGDDMTNPDNRSKFVGLLAEIVETVDGKY